MDTKTAQRQLVTLITQHLSDSIPVTRILTYKPNTNGSVVGKFESLGRVFNFVFNGMDVKYKPSGNMDSDLFSEYYLQRFDAAPRVASGKPRAIPKCTSKSYSCKGEKGVACITLTHHCKMANTAIGNERLNKIRGLAKMLASSGEDTTKIEATRAKIVEQRLALAAENRAKRTPKKIEKVVAKVEPEYKGKSTPFKRKAKPVEVAPVVKSKKEKAVKAKKTPELTTKEMTAFMDGLSGAISTVAPVTKVDTFKIDPKTRTISGTYTSKGAKFTFAINRDGSITTKSAKTKKRTDSAEVQCTGNNRPCKGEKGTRCIPPEQSCHVDDPGVVAAGASVLNHLDRLLGMHGIDAIQNKYQEMAEKTKVGSEKVVDKKEPKKKDKDLEEDHDDFEKEEGDYEDEPKYERRKGLIYFNHAISGEDLGFTGDEDDLPSDREMTKRLKAHAAKLTKNKITGLESDGWTLYFKEVVPHEFDHNPNQPLWAQLSDEDIHPQYDRQKKRSNYDVSSMKLLPRK